MRVRLQTAFTQNRTPARAYAAPRDTLALAGR